MANGKPHQHTRIEKLLRMFTTLRPGEGTGALLMAANAFLILTTYYLLKTVREALILTQGGAEVKSYSAAAQAALLLLLVPAYSRLTSRLSRSAAVTAVTLFFAANLLVFAGFDATGVAVGIPFFIWVGVFNVTLIAQFWSYASDAWNEEQGKRLLPVAGIGSSLGALVGAKLAGPLFKSMGSSRLMLVAAGILAVCVFVNRLVEQRLTRTSAVQAAKARTALEPGAAFRMVFRNRYLLLIALFVVLLNVVNTSGEFLLSRLVTDAAKEAVGPSRELQKQFIGQFYSEFFGWVNLAGMAVQLFLVSRVFRYIGVRMALFIVPCIAMGGYSLLALAPVLSVVRIAKILENAGDYSLQNSTRHALFLRTTREERYKAKAAIDTFFWRAGDLLQAGIVLIGTKMAYTTADFAKQNLIVTGLWLCVVALIYREYGATAKVEAEPDRVSRKLETAQAAA